MSVIQNVVKGLLLKPSMALVGDPSLRSGWIPGSKLITFNGVTGWTTSLTPVN